VRAARESMRLPKTTFRRYTVGLGIVPPGQDPKDKGVLDES